MEQWMGRMTVDAGNEEISGIEWWLKEENRQTVEDERM